MKRGNIMVGWQVNVILSFWLTTAFCIIQQPDDVLNGDYDYMDHNITHLCTRTCVVGAPAKVCYYKFTLEPYTVLGGACKNCPETRADCFNEQCVSADGVPKPILTINRRIAGPSIQVCVGDTIIVDVVNRLKGRSVTIHWHGIHQKETPFMDGVPMITQCPILEGQEFRYKFKADRPGTNFYHSASGLQKLDGISGSLIIRSPKSRDLQRNFFDQDLPSHTMVIQDWMHSLADNKQPNLLQNPSTFHDSYLINGRGLYAPNISDVLSLKTPITEFRVREGQRYRFRVISNLCFACTIELTFESHPMTVIASDERDLEPLVFDKIVLTSGERYDIVINTKEKARTYWITVKGLGRCGEGIYQIAALKYIPNTSGDVTPAVNPIAALTSINQNDVVLNRQDINCTYVENNGRCVSKMRSRQTTPSIILKQKPDLRLKITFNFIVYDENRLFTMKPYLPFIVPVPFLKLHMLAMVNNKSFSMPPSPLLTQRADIPKDLFCTPECEETLNPCQCLNIIKVPLNSVVEIIIADVDSSPLSHPFHLHGHSIHLVTQGKWGTDWKATLQDLYNQLESGVFLHNRLPVKDTVAVPSKGYTVFRVLFDNPGYWLFHCHFLYHLVNGMSTVFQVGDENDVEPIPQGFPKCGNYLPDF